MRFASGALQLLIVLLAACGGPERARRRPEPLPTESRDSTHRDWSADLAALNAEARRGAVSQTLHGVAVADPYRALETESPLTQRWVATQTERTAEALRAAAPTRERIRTFLSIGSIDEVRVGGDRVFYEKRSEEREQPRLFVRHASDAEQLLIDPTTFGERAALDWYYPSPDGTKVAFGISQNGDEKSVLHVFDLERTESPLRPLRIPRTKWCNLAWLPDGSGFYYSRYPKEGEDGYDAEREDAYFPRVFFHSLNDEAEEGDHEEAIQDVRVFGSQRGTDFPIPQVSADGRWLVINLFRGWSASDVFLFDRGRRGEHVGPASGQRFVTVTEGHDSLTRAVAHRGELFLWTNRDAPRYRLMRVSTSRAGDVQRWREIIPQREAVLDDWALTDSGIVAHYLEEVRSQLVLFDHNGGQERAVDLPTRGAIDSLAGDPQASVVALAYSGYLQPPSLFTVDFSNASLTELERVSTDLDLSRYTVRLEHVPSADGTLVPVHLIHRSDQPVDGSARVLLYGYGGFNISLLPRFSRSALYWLERGGVYAVANLRGGGELGESWHRAGMLGNKPRVFEDFESVLGWLTQSGLSRPERIGITGGSNGGLLMGAMITRVPDRFRAAASYVGLYDMVRYPEFPPAELWMTEYGNPAESEAFGWLHDYSPYHRVREGIAYPAVLIETADHDSRVHWAHSTKFTAVLQEATTSGLPIYFHMDRQQGHGAGTRLSDQVQKYARMYAFFHQQLEGGDGESSSASAPSSGGDSESPR